jgi:PAS domain S-box-containing protein
MSAHDLEEIMNRLFDALATTADGAFVVDGAQRIIYWNAAAATLTGYSHIEAQGANCQAIMGATDDSGKQVCCARCRTAARHCAGMPVPSIDIAIRTKSAAIRWVNMSTFVYPLDEKKTVLVHLFRDAARKQQREQFMREVHTDHHFVPARDAEPPAIQALSRPHSVLTHRENQVLLLLVRGQSTQEIAETLVISKSTARNHIRHLLSKLDVHSRLEAVSYAIQYGLVALADV